MIRLYCASKQYMAEAWRDLRVQIIDVDFTMRWVDQPSEQTTAERTKFSTLNQQDIQRCDAIVVYGAHEDVLCDTLVAVGMGLMASKTVICVGSSKSFGGWQHHNDVYKAKTVMEAIELARRLYA